MPAETVNAFIATAESAWPADYQEPEGSAGKCGCWNLRNS